MERQRARSTQEIASLIPVRLMEEMQAEPLPSPWSYGVTQDGRVFFINEESQSTTWLHPGFNHPVQTGHLYDQGLPSGWEVNITSGDVLYYIDHINRSTTFQFPEGEVQPLTRNKEKKSFRFQRSSSKRKSGKQKVIDKMASVKRDVDAPVSIRGWLNRQEVSGPLKTWKRRWCVLADFCLFFYKGSDEGQVLGSLLLPSFKVNPCVKDEDGISKRCAFKAEHENVKTMFFYADTDEEMEKWIEVMRAASDAEFHSIEDNDVRFQRSQSQNAIGPRTDKAQNSPDGAKDDEFGFESQYGRRQNSMPSGIDLVRQNTDARSDGNRSRAGDPPYGRDGKITGDAGSMMNSSAYNPEPPRVNADKRDVSSSEDDFMYVKDLNLSQRPTAVADSKEKNVQPTGPSLDQTYRPGTQNPNTPSFYAEDRKNVVDSQFKNDNSTHGRYPRQPERTFLERSPVVPGASHQASYAPAAMSSGAELNQKLSPSAKSPNSTNQNNFVYSPAQDLKLGSVGSVGAEGRLPGETSAGGLYLDASRSGGMNSEAELLDAIRNQKIDRTLTDVSGSRVYPEARLRSPGRAPDHADGEHQTIAEAKEKFPGSFDLRPGAPHHRVAQPPGPLENPGGQAWSAKQLGRLVVEAPLRRVEEWTMEQRRQHQELQLRNGERSQRRMASDVGQSGYHNPSFASQPTETHWKPEQNMGSSPSKMSHPSVDSAGGGGKTEANCSVNVQLPGFKMQETELGVGQYGQKNSNYGNQAPDIHKHVNHKEQDRNPAYGYHGNQPAMSNRSQDSMADFTTRPPLASQNNFAKSSPFSDVPVQPGSGSQQPGKLDTVLDTGDAQGSFADVSRSLSENARLCQECSSVITQQALNIDTLIDRLIKLRRSQMKLEEGRYALLGRIHVQMMQPTKDLSKTSVKAVQDKLSDVEGQIADTNALISELDRRLTNLRSAELSSVKPSELAFTSQGQSADSEKRLPPGPAPDKQPSPSSLTPSGMALDAKTERGHQEAYALRKQLEQESNFVNNLREEKSRLEKALSKTMRDEQMEKDPNNLLVISRQKQAIDRELYSLQNKLTFAIKNLENVKKRCVQMDQGMVSMQNHNSEKASGNALSGNKSFSMSANPGAVDGKSNDFGGSGSTYFETDLDTGRCVDLGLMLQKSGAQSNQTGFDVRQKGDGRQPQAFSQMRTSPGDVPDRNKELSTRSNHSSIPLEKQVGIAKNPPPGGAENGRDASSGRLRGLEREPFLAPEELAARQNPPSDSRYRAAKGDDDFYGNSNPGYFPVSADRSAGAEPKFKASSDYPNWNNPPNLGHNRAALPSANPIRLPEGPVLGTEGAPHRTGQYEILPGHGREVDHLSHAASLRDPSSAQQWNSSRPPDTSGSSIVHEKRGTDGTSQSHIGAAVRNERTNNAHGQSFNDYNAGRNAGPGMQDNKWNPVKPPRLPAESREWQRGTELRSNFSIQNPPGHPAQHYEEKSKVADYGSNDENMNTVVHRPRSKSLSREWDDQPDQSNRTARNLDARDYHQEVDAEPGQSSPTGGIGPRDRIRRMSGFFTPKPFKGSGSAASSAQTNSVDERNSSAVMMPLQNEAYGQHIDQIFYPPQKVEIPQQYNEDHANEALSPEEAQLRREKAEKFRKMIAAQSLQEFSKGELTTQSGGLHHRVQDERRRREQMLDTRQLLAQEVSRRTRQGSDNAPRVRTVEELLKDSDDGQYL